MGAPGVSPGVSPACPMWQGWPGGGGWGFPCPWVLASAVAALSVPVPRERDVSDGVFIGVGSSGCGKWVPQPRELLRDPRQGEGFCGDPAGLTVGQENKEGQRWRQQDPWQCPPLGFGVFLRPLMGPCPGVCCAVLVGGCCESCRSWVSPLPGTALCQQRAAAPLPAGTGGLTAVLPEQMRGTREEDPKGSPLLPHTRRL